MTATFTFTVTGADHRTVLAEAHKVATSYWGGRNNYVITDIVAHRYRDAIGAQVDTKLNQVAG